MRRFIKNFFFPTLQNNLKPYSLSYETFATVIALMLVLELSFCIYAIAFKINLANRTLAIPPISAGTIMIANESFQRVMVSSILIVGNILVVFLVYVLSVILVPILMISFKHHSVSKKRKIYEIYTLFNESIHRTQWTVLGVLAMYLTYSFVVTYLFLV